MPYRINRDEYPSWIGLVFVFNLIVGTGALTLPAVFAKAGWILGLIIVSFLAFVSYMTVTFIIESIACANAVLYWRRLQFLKRDQIQSDYEVEDNQSEINNWEALNDNPDINIEQTPLFSQRARRYYIIDNKIELGEMALLFLNDSGRIFFYLCLAIYLYGDLSIYSAAVSKTLRDVICSTNVSINATNNDPCWHNYTWLSRLDVYRLSLVTFAILLGPFTFFNVQKTKYIQMLTALFRWLAFTIMITIAVGRLITHGVTENPMAINLKGLPSLFGTCIYSFMCHHSLPSLLAPIHDKKRIQKLMLFDYGLICSFYLFLAITGTLAFSNLEDLYTLNFIPNQNQLSIILNIIDYFLILFPVFTLATSFPIIAITLRNNLQTLFLDMSQFDTYNLFYRRLLFPILAIAPPFIITYFTENITSLVGFTGSYAGAGIQYLIPIALVYFARRTCSDLLGEGITNDFQSPFKNTLWLVFVFLWSCVSTIIVTLNLFSTL